MKFSADKIEEHANACLEAQEKNPFTCYAQFSKETAVEVIVDDEENDLVPGCLKQDEFICKVKGVLAGVIQSDEIVIINVRRSFCFSEFYDFFQKKWNKKAIYYQYQIRLMGEAGIDTGGLTRDFYSSKLDVMFCTS